MNHQLTFLLISCFLLYLLYSYPKGFIRILLQVCAGVCLDRLVLALVFALALCRCPLPLPLHLPSPLPFNLPFKLPCKWCMGTVCVCVCAKTPPPPRKGRARGRHRRLPDLCFLPPRHRPCQRHRLRFVRRSAIGEARRKKGKQGKHAGLSPQEKTLVSQAVQLLAAIMKGC